MKKSYKEETGSCSAVFSFCRRMPLHPNRMLSRDFRFKILDYPASYSLNLALFYYHIFPQFDDKVGKFVEQKS